MAVQLALSRRKGDAAPTSAAEIENLVIAGWTGRDAAGVEKHIRELEEIGVKRPSRTPIFYRVAASLLTTADAIQVVGGDSSGEVEFVMLSLADGLWVGVGSDHTDRKVEAVDVTVSKQMCAKVIGPEVWRYEEVAPHWDRLVLRSWAHIAGKRTLYQEGAVAGMRHPEELTRLYTGKSALPPGTAMFGGTHAVHGGVRPASQFDIELDDPVLGRKITHSYRIEPLPVEA
jgi:Protein of unknown function (DUF2848)